MSIDSPAPSFSRTSQSVKSRVRRSAHGHMKSMLALNRGIGLQPLGRILQCQKQRIDVWIEKQDMLSAILDLHGRLNHGTGRIQFQFQRKQPAILGLKTQSELLATFSKVGNQRLPR